MPRSCRNNHRRSITSVRSNTQSQLHRPLPNGQAPLPHQPFPGAHVQPQQPPPTTQQGFEAMGGHPVSPRGGFGGGRGRDYGNGWWGGGGHQNNNTNTGSLGWTTTETGSGNGGGGQNNNTGSSGWTTAETGGGGFSGTLRAEGAPAEGGDVHMGSSTADGSGVGARWGGDAPENGGGNDNGGGYNNGSNYNHGHNNDYRRGRGRGGRGEWWGDRGGIRGGRGGRGGRGDWGVRGDRGGRGGRGDLGIRGGRRGRGGRGGRGAWGGQGDTHEAPNTHSSSGWGETGNNSTNQTGWGQGTETHITANTDASSAWGGTSTNAVGINNSTESRGNDGDANSGWGVNNSVPQTVWTSTEVERNKRPPDQSAGNAAKKLKSYVLHELEQVRRRVEEWEAGWDEEREGEGVVERAVEGGGLVEKMVWQSEATFLVVWPAWMWGAAAAAGFGDIGGRSRIDERRFSWAKQMPGQRMVGAEGVVEPE